MRTENKEKTKKTDISNEQQHRQKVPEIKKDCVLEYLKLGGKDSPGNKKRWEKQLEKLNILPKLQ